MYGIEREGIQKYRAQYVYKWPCQQFITANIIHFQDTKIIILSNRNYHFIFVILEPTNGLMAKGKIAPLSDDDKPDRQKILSDPVFKLSRWMGVFFLTRDLEISYRTLATGIVLFVVLAVERVSFLIVFPLHKHMMVITILFVSVYYLNWSIVMFRPIGGLRKALRESLDIAQRVR